MTHSEPPDNEAAESDSSAARDADTTDASRSTEQRAENANDADSRSASTSTALEASSPPDESHSNEKKALAEHPGEPPVVARMIVEIRSDGTRTIARGAIEEATTGERVAVEAHGTSPMALAASLAKSMFSAPMLAKQAVRALLAARRTGRSSDPDDEP